jgi:hypothetical protein
MMQAIRTVFKFPVAAAAVCLALVVTTALAATTSRLTGAVVDAEGLPLPGVAIRLSSDVLIGGEQVAITAVDGSFAFNLLPPGLYNLHAELTGFRPADAEARVRLDNETQVRIQMVMQEFAGEIEVVAEVPVIDATQVASGQSFTEDFLQNAAVGSNGRDYLSIIGNEAGSVGSGNIRVLGSVQSDNVYLVDGLNTTDPLTATFGTNFNYDAIQEVSLQTGGYEAEFGQALGGVVNLVTKSGGNDLSGSVDVRYQDEGFYESGDHFDADQTESTFQQYSMTVGGPMIRDRLWFFVSGRLAITKTTPTGSPFVRKFDGIDYIGKLTWQASDAHRLVFKLSGDPAEINGANAGPLETPESEQYAEQGGNIYQAELDSVLSESVLVTAQVGINRGFLKGEPASGDFLTPAVVNQDTGVTSENFNQIEDSDRDRDQLKAAITWFIDDLAGSHELKLGTEYQRTYYSGLIYRPGNREFQPLNYDGADPNGSGGEDFDGDGLTDFILYEDIPEASSKRDAEGRITTFFMQDAWRPTANLTIKPGVRYDQAEFDNQFGDTVTDFSELQPRLGFAWDLLGDGKNVLRASFGRFMHPASVNLADTVSGVSLGSYYYFGAEWLCGNNDLCDPAFLEQILGAPISTIDSSGNEHLWYFGGSTGLDPFETVDTLGVGTLEAQYADHYILAFERQLWAETSLEIQYQRKQTRDLIEDTCVNNTWVWGDGPRPSYDDPSTWTDTDECTGFVLANVPGLKRDWEGFIAKFETRTERFHILASYTHATSEGNTDAEANAAYATYGTDEFPRDFYNYYGYLSDDRRHRVKAQGYVLLPWDLTVGFDAFWSSEPALDYFGTCGVIPASDPNFPYCNSDVGDLYLEPRGSRRGGENYQLDLQLSKAFNLGNTQLQAIVAVINAFSNERPQLYEEYEYRSRPWGTVLTYQQPRRYELGFRLEF